MSQYFNVINFSLPDEKEKTFMEDAFEYIMDKNLPIIKERITDLCEKMDVPLEEVNIGKEYVERKRGIFFKKQRKILKNVIVEAVFPDKVSKMKEAKIIAALNGFKWGYNTETVRG